MKLNFNGRYVIRAIRSRVRSPLITDMVSLTDGNDRFDARVGILENANDLIRNVRSSIKRYNNETQIQ